MPWPFRREASVSLAFHTCPNQTKTKTSVKNKIQMFSDSQWEMVTWSVAGTYAGSWLLSAFVFYICGKVSLILSFCRANASRTSSRVLGSIEQPWTCAHHTLPHLFRAPSLLMEFVCSAGGKPSCPQPRLNCPGGGSSMACEAAWRKSKHIYLVASALFNFLLSASGTFSLMPDA